MSLNFNLVLNFKQKFTFKALLYIKLRQGMKDETRSILYSKLHLFKKTTHSALKGLL